MDNITIELQEGVYMVRRNGRLLAITHSYAEAVKAVVFFEQRTGSAPKEREVKKS